MPNNDDALRTHTPTPEHFFASAQRRALELIGTPRRVINTLVPLPYESKYPYSNKFMDAMLTAGLDPVVKPLSINGQIDRLPILKKLSKELADRGYFHRYPGGGIGIGGGPGGSDSGDSPGTGATGEGSSTGDAANAAAAAAAGASVSPTAAAANDAAANALGMSAAGTSISVLSGLLGAVPGGQIGAIGLAALGAALSLSAHTGIGLGGTGDPSAPGLGPSSVGGDEVLNQTSALPSAAVSSPGGPAPTSISPSTRSNAAARVGGGISPSFLEVLEGLRG